jgi:hypothetical protein
MTDAAKSPELAPDHPYWELVDRAVIARVGNRCVRDAEAEFWAQVSEGDGQQIEGEVAFGVDDVFGIECRERFPEVSPEQFAKDVEWSILESA